jgi:hypothetical protein
LALTNGPLALNLSRLFARRLWMEAAGKESAAACRNAFAQTAFEHVLSRAPSAGELAACCRFLEKQVLLFESGTMPAATESSETIAPSTDPALRAAENLVHALFNHNDFVTIR